MSDHHVPALRQRFLDDMRIKGLLPKTQTMYLRAMREFRVSKVSSVVNQTKLTRL